jgi:histidine triad (HIT) family protein
MADEPCVFCDIVAGKAPAHVVHEDERCLCILDIQPLTRGHCLVIPKRHVPWWHQLSAEENASLFRVAQEVSTRMMERLEPDFVCLYVRGRRIPHTHLFLVPTFQGDVIDRLFSTLEIFQEGSNTLARLGDPAQMKEALETLRRP